MGTDEVMVDPTLAMCGGAELVSGELEISVVIPCLNEEGAVGEVVDQAWAGIARSGRTGEVIVVDNGSTDDSAEIARNHGARVVSEPEPGYGSAYQAGIAAANGRTIVMSDADGTYPLQDLCLFVDRVEGGDDLVLGSRFAGTIRNGAMPWPNRLIGNPILTGMLRLLVGVKVSDAHCGMRAIGRRQVALLGLDASGMEFASEMVLKAHKRRLRISEIPIDYFPRIGESKLHRTRDAWRHVRFMLLNSPSYLFLVPALILFIPGLLGLLAFADGPIRLFGRTWQIHTAFAFATLTLLGVQISQFGFVARTYATVQLGESDPLLEWLSHRFRLEHGLLAGATATLVGGTLLAVPLVRWALSGFGALGAEYIAVIGFTLAGVGTQTIFGSFLISIVGRPRRPATPAPATPTPAETHTML